MMRIGRAFKSGRARGAYVLSVRLPQELVIAVGGLGKINFRGGCYAYVGSAMGGLESRLNRHLRRDKKAHWHIDYLLEEANIFDIIVAESEKKLECLIAQELARQFDFVPGFGCSDCRCRSHLFFDSGEGLIKDAIRAVIESLGMPPQPVPMN